MTSRYRQHGNADVGLELIGTDGQARPISEHFEDLANGATPWIGDAVGGASIDFSRGATGGVSQTFLEKGSEWRSTNGFGAVGDAVITNATGSIAASSTALTVSGASFAPADTGKTILVPGAGAAGADLITTLTYVDATHVTLADAASTGIDAPVTTSAAGSITAGSKTLSVSGASFTSGDTGKRIVIPGAGVGGVSLTTKMTYVSSTSVTLDYAAGTTVSNVAVTYGGTEVYYGTDDTAALQKAFDSGELLIIPQKNFLTRGGINTSNCFGFFGIGEPSLLALDKTTYIFRIDGALKFGTSLKLWYAGGVTASHTAAVGLLLDSFRWGFLNRINIQRTYKAISTGTTPTLAPFSNHFSVITIRDFIKNGLIYEHTTGGGATGDVWNSLYVTGYRYDQPVYVDLKGSPIDLKATDQVVFNQLNTEWCKLFTATGADGGDGIDYPIISLTGGDITAIINSWHMEGIKTLGANAQMVTLTARCLMNVKGWMINNADFEPTNWVNLAKFSGDNSSLRVEGLMEKQSSNTITAGKFRPSWTGGSSRAGCSLSLEQYYLPSLTLNVAANLTSDGLPVLRASNGDRTTTQRSYLVGTTLAKTGTAGSDVALALDVTMGKVNLTAANSGSDSGFKLPVGTHGQEVLVTLSTKGGAGNGVLKPDSGVTIVTLSEGAVATVTFGTVGQVCLLRYEYDRWRIIRTTGTVA